MNRKSRFSLLIPAAAAALSFAGLARAEEPSAGEQDPAMKGTVGVCVRWGADPAHLAEVIIVEPSGNSALDSVVPNTLRGMEWKKPDGYQGEWIGLSVGVAGASPTGRVPDCGSLTEPAMGPARPLATGKKTAA